MPDYLTPFSVMVMGASFIFGLIPRNWFYGLRTPQTLANDAAWYSRNRIGGYVLIGAGAIWITDLAVRQFIL